MFALEISVPTLTGDEGDKIMMKSAHEKANRRKREITSERGSPVFKKKGGPGGPRRPLVRGLQVAAGGSGPHTGTASFAASKSGQDKGTPHSPHRE